MRVAACSSTILTRRIVYLSLLLFFRWKLCWWSHRESSVLFCPVLRQFFSSSCIRCGVSPYRRYRGICVSAKTLCDHCNGWMAWPLILLVWVLSSFFFLKLVAYRIYRRNFLPVAKFPLHSPSLQKLKMQSRNLIYISNLPSHDIDSTFLFSISPESSAMRIFFLSWRKESDSVEWVLSEDRKRETESLETSHRRFSFRGVFDGCRLLAALRCSDCSDLSNRIDYQQRQGIRGIASLMMMLF